MIPGRAGALAAARGYNTQPTALALRFNSTNATSYVDCGTISLPAGDWAIFYSVNQGTTGGLVGQCHICIGTPSDTLLASASHLTFGLHNAPGASTYALNQLMVSGRDVNNLNFGTRQVLDYMDLTSTVNVLSGLPMTSSGACLVVLQKSGSEIQLWQVLKNHTAVLMHTSLNMGAWAGLTNQPMLIGALNRLTKTAFTAGGTRIMGVGKVSKAMTAAQMERIAAGANPVSVLAMSTAAGDLYWPFKGTLAATVGATQADVLQGQVATVAGTANWGVPTALLPDLEPDNDVRLLHRPTYHCRSNPGTIRIDGTYRARGTIDVQARLLNSGTQAVLQDWQTVATAVSGGAWTGTLSNVTRQLLNYEIQIRLVIDGVTQTAQTLYVAQAGVVVQILGQSLAERIRVSTPWTLAMPANLYGFTASTVPPAAGGSVYVSAPQQARQRGWAVLYQHQAGYGEEKLADLISTGAGCRVVICCDAQEGSAAGSWIADQNRLMTRAVESLTRTGGGFVIWEQGQADQSGDYTVKMETIYQMLVTALGASNFDFLVSPLALTLTTASSNTAIWSRRREQYNWAKAKVAAGVTTVDVADNNTNDITLADFIHQTGDAAGAGRMVERWAQTILKRMGVATYTGEGPTITGITWDGATSIAVHLTQNGGTGLQTPAGGNITGFEYSANGGSAWAALSAAVITDATTITLTMPSTPAQAPRVRYQYGGPGAAQPLSGDTDAQRRTKAGIDNPVYDNRTPGINTALGFPVGGTVADLV